MEPRAIASGVVGRVHKDRLLLDARTVVSIGQSERLLQCLLAALAKLS